MGVLALFMTGVMSFTTAGLKENTNSEINKFYGNISTYIKILESSLEEDYKDKYREIFNHSMSIRDNYQKKIRNEIMSDCESQLKDLADNKVRGQFFYNLLYDKTKNVRKDGNIKNVCDMDCLLWETKYEERKYYIENRNARINNNITIYRIFILDKEYFTKETDKKVKKDKYKIILKHIIDDMELFVVSKSDAKSLHLENISIFDDRLILLDGEVPQKDLTSNASGKLIEKGLKDDVEFDRLKNKYDYARVDSKIKRIVNLEAFAEFAELKTDDLIQEAIDYIKCELDLANQEKNDKLIKHYQEKEDQYVEMQKKYEQSKKI